MQSSAGSAHHQQPKNDDRQSRQLARAKWRPPGRQLLHPQPGSRNARQPTVPLPGLRRPSVPDDVSIVGYNDIPIVSHLPTPLTTVRVPFEQIASNALDLLTHGAASADDRIRLSAPTLIPRKSTSLVGLRL